MARQEFADWYDAIDSDEYSKLDIAQAAWDAALKSVEENDSSPNSKSTQGCVICGCNISLRGYCAGCQTRVD